MRYFSIFLSYLFQPLFLPVYALQFYLLGDHYRNALLRLPEISPMLNRFAILQLILVVIIPLASMIIMKRSGIISSYQVNDRKERLPVIFMVLCYNAIAYYLFSMNNTMYAQIFGPFLTVLTAGLLIGLIGLFVTLSKKISLHAMGMAGFAGAFIALNELLFPYNNQNNMFFWNATLILLIGLVGTARLFLKAHSLIEVFAGSFLGFGIGFISVYLNFSL